MASEHTVGFEPADRLAKERESVRRRFWIKLKRVVAKLPFAEDLLAAYYCAFDKQTPRHVQAALLGAIAYFILPFDFIPDMLPVLGFTEAVGWTAAGACLGMTAAAGAGAGFGNSSNRLRATGSMPCWSSHCLAEGKRCQPGSGADSETSFHFGWKGGFWKEGNLVKKASTN